MKGRGRGDERAPRRSRRGAAMFGELRKSLVVWVAVMVAVAAMTIGEAAVHGAKTSAHGDKCLKPKRGRAVSKTASAGATVPMWRKSGLTLCNRFAHKTCCSRTQTDVLYILWKAAVVAEFSPRCQEVYETALCMECDPDVGTGKVTSMCRSLCDDWYKACKDEFFAVSSVSGEQPKPCLESTLVCSQLNSFVSSGSDFCSKFGFSVSDEFCYLGKADPSQYGKEEPISSSSSSSSSSSKYGPQGLYEQIIYSLKNPDLKTYVAIAVGGITLSVLFSLSFIIIRGDGGQELGSGSKRLGGGKISEREARELLARGFKENGPKEDDDDDDDDDFED